MDLDPELAFWILEFVFRRYVRFETANRLLAMIPSYSELEYPLRVQRAIAQRRLLEGLTRRLINTVTLDNIEALQALRPLPSAADAYCIVAVHLAASATDLASAVADLWEHRVANILRSPSKAELASQRLISEGRNLCLAIAQPALRTRIVERFTKNQALDAVRALLEADYEDVGPPILELVVETIDRDEAENMPSSSRAGATIPPVVAQQQQATPVVAQQQQATPVVAQQQQATPVVAQQQATPRVAQQQQATPRVAQQQATPRVAQREMAQITPGAAQQQATQILGRFTKNQALDAVRALLEADYEDVGPSILERVAETVDRDETENLSSGSQAEATIPPVVALQQATLRDALLQATPRVAQREMAQIMPGAAQQQATPLAAQQQATPLAAQQQETPVAAQQQETPVVAQQQATPRVAQREMAQITPGAAQQQATPRAAQQQATPRAAQQQATPVVAQQQATPRVAQREMAQITPGAAQQQATPSAAQQQATCRAAQQQATPIVAQQQATPRVAQQQATPRVAQQQTAQIPPPFVAQQQATPRVAQQQTAQIPPPFVAQQQTKDIPPEQQQSTQMPSGAKATQMPPQGGESHALPGGKEMPRQSEIDGGRLGKGTTTTMNEEGNSNKAMERGPAARTYERDGRLKGKAVCPPTLVESKRRKMRRWSVLEEDTLRSAVRELGRGYWKEILRSHSDVFEGRTEVDLKDKWRNMIR